MRDNFWAGVCNTRRGRSLLAAVSFMTWVVVSSHSAVSADDVDLWERILMAHTRLVDDLAGTRVDYAGLRDSADLRALVASLDKSDPQLLETREEKLAFWINAYNILAIDLVARHYPVDGIRDIGSWLRPVWKIDAGRIGGRAYSLDEIEHGILRPLGEPRIHGAIVCASASCPPLRREPYRAARIDDQLNDNVRRWLRDPRKGVRIDPKQQRVYLSPIFKWFADDFQGGALAFVAMHTSETQRRWLERQGAQAKIVWLDYDWSLNDLAGIRSTSNRRRSSLLDRVAHRAAKLRADRLALPGEALPAVAAIAATDNRLTHASAEFAGLRLLRPR